MAALGGGGLFLVGEVPLYLHKIVLSTSGPYQINKICKNLVNLICTNLVNLNFNYKCCCHFLLKFGLTNPSPFYNNG